MYTQRTLCTQLLLVLAALGCFGTGRTQADPITYHVTVDTTSLDQEYGYLFVQFNPGPGGAALASATVTNFFTDGTLNPNDPLNGPSGDVSGSLPGTLILTNDQFPNYYLEGFTYGNSIQFDVMLSGPGLNSPGTSSSGSSFAFSLEDSTSYNPLLTTDPNGSVLTINVNPDATTSVETFPQSPTDNTPAASAFLPPQSSVPAPPSLVLFLVAVPAGLVYWRRSR